MSVARWTLVPYVVLCLCVADAQISGAPRQASGDNCSFRQDPDAFLSRQGRAIQDVVDRSRRAGKARTEVAMPVAAATIPRRSFVDDAIFDALQRAGVAVAPLSTEEEFLRRITLDLTGRIPTPQDVRDFVANPDPDKRNQLIDRLLYSPEFVDRWTMWMGDLLSNTAFAPSTSNLNPQISGRNAFYNWIKLAINGQKSLRDIAYETVSSATATPPAQTVTVLTGDRTTWDSNYGPANFALTAQAAMGPVQDSYDLLLAKTASTFLGVGHYDCLLCHNGRGHLDQLSLWAKTVTRTEAEQMAAFFSRWRWTQQNLTTGGNANNRPWYVYDAATGQYDLNTTFGNRPNRVALGPKTEDKSLTPVYRDGSKPKDSNWRQAFAAKLVDDPMFARNFANRLWKQMFTLGLVDPVDQMDPARLDPANPPAAPWTLQATHPELLEQLAKSLVSSNYDLRQFLRLLAQSSAYQLSSRYDGEWNLAYVPLFARHYPRRLEGEEVHDAIITATGVLPKYTVQEWGDQTVSYAMQLPDPNEPRSNGGSANFMNTFFRGNRDTARRTQDGSIQQQMALMNDTFVVSRIKLAASPKLTAISKLSANDQIVEEIFLTFLGRRPSGAERDRSLTLLSKATTTQQKTDAIQDLAWACVNKIDFLFSY